MPANRRELLDAATSHRPRSEDRLTELLATVLDAHGEFCGVLFDELGLAREQRFSVATQVGVAPGCRLDMEVRAFDTRGGLVSRLWCEHKLDAELRDSQRNAYRPALDRLPGDSRFMLVVPQCRPEHQSESWTVLTWQRIAELADDVGRGWSGPDWRERALKPDAPARARLLHELLWYFEREDLAVVDALTDHTVSVYRHAARSMETVGVLLDRAAEEAAPLEPVGMAAREPELQWIRFKEPPGGWLHRVTSFGAAAELVAADRDVWRVDPTGDPSFGAGYAFPKELYDALAVRPEWVAKLDAQGYGFEASADWLYIYRTLPMSELAVEATTMERQAQALGSWAREAIETLGRMDPGELVLPEPKRRRAHS